MLVVVVVDPYETHAGCVNDVVEVADDEAANRYIDSIREKSGSMRWHFVIQEVSKHEEVTA